MKTRDEQATDEQPMSDRMRLTILDAHREMEFLRRRNEVLQARVDVIEVFRVALLSGGGPRIGMSHEPSVRLDRLLEDDDKLRQREEDLRQERELRRDPSLGEIPGDPPLSANAGGAPGRGLESLAEDCR